jgi:transcriptional regulator with XRE-family HTH domain
MNDAKASPGLGKYRTQIARKVQQLRKERHWTQAELSRRLHLSQSRLSEIEQGDGSFTAEQFLEILRLFNVAASDFAPPPAGADRGVELQNALARLGGDHLQESTDVLPSERLSNVNDVIREALVAPEFPRLTAALVPVLVRNVDQVALKKLYADLAGAGLERRLAWLVDNALEAIRRELPAAPQSWRKLYRRAQVVLGSFLGFVTTESSQKQPFAPDVFDPGIRSKQTLEAVAASASQFSRNWGIVSNLQPEDFADALRGARAARP